MRGGSFRLSAFEQLLYVGKNVNLDTQSNGFTAKPDRLSLLSANESNTIEIEEFIDK